MVKASEYTFDKYGAPSKKRGLQIYLNDCINRIKSSYVL